MEKDNELKGEGNSYDYGARFYDPRIGRWFAKDPFSNSLPFISPYSTSANNPILYIDLNGYIFVIPNNLTKVQKLKVQFMIDVLKLMEPEIYEKLNTSPIKINVSVGIIDQTGVAPNTVLNGYAEFPGQSIILKDIDGKWQTKGFQTSVKQAFLADEEKYSSVYDEMEKNGKNPFTEMIEISEEMANKIAQLNDDQEINVVVSDNDNLDFLAEIGGHEFGHTYFGIINPAYRYILNELLPNAKGHIENKKETETHPNGKAAFKLQMSIQVYRDLKTDARKDKYDKLVNDYKIKIKESKKEEKNKKE